MKQAISSSKTLLFTALMGLFVAMSFPASAADDYSSLVSGIDFASVATGILAIGAAVCGVYVVMKGVMLIISALKRA